MCRIGFASYRTTIGLISTLVLLLGLASSAPAQTTVTFAQSTKSVNENAGSVTVDVVLNIAATSTVTVNYATADATAKSPNDFMSQSGTLVFAVGDVKKTISIMIMTDAFPEGDETFTITLSNPSNATLGSPSTATITITEGGGSPPTLPTVQFASATYSVAEGTAPTGNYTKAAITVNLSATSTSPVTVSYGFAAGGSAATPADYKNSPGTLTIPANTLFATFNVEIVPDSDVESNETINLELSIPMGATLGTQKTATLTITDDDEPTVIPFQVTLSVINDPYPNPISTGASTVSTIEAAATRPTGPVNGPSWGSWQIEKVEFSLDSTGPWTQDTCTGSFSPSSAPPGSLPDPLVDKTYADCSLTFSKIGYWKVTVKETVKYFHPSGTPIWQGTGTVELPLIYACFPGDEITVASVKWEGFKHKDDKTNFFPAYDGMKDKGGGDVLFAERNNPEGWTDEDEIHNKIKVKVSLNKPVPKGISVEVAVRIFDPDIYDLNKITSTKGEGNNIKSDGTNVGFGHGASSSGPVTFGDNEITKELEITILPDFIQPTNNWIVAAHTDSKYLDSVKFDDDGKTLIDDKKNKLSTKNQTNTITIWRTLYVERHRMSDPEYTKGTAPSRVASGKATRRAGFTNTFDLDVKMPAAAENQFNGGYINLLDKDDAVLKAKQKVKYSFHKPDESLFIVLDVDLDEADAKAVAKFTELIDDDLLELAKGKTLFPATTASDMEPDLNGTYFTRNHFELQAFGLVPAAWLASRTASVGV